MAYFCLRNMSDTLMEMNQLWIVQRYTKAKILSILNFVVTTSHTSDTLFPSWWATFSLHLYLGNPTKVKPLFGCNRRQKLALFNFVLHCIQIFQFIHKKRMINSFSVTIVITTESCFFLVLLTTVVNIQLMYHVC